MDIVLVADFCGDFSGVDNGRFRYLAEILSQNHDVELITSDFFHDRKEYLNLINVNKFPFKITALHEKKYTKNICINRLYSHFMWGKAVKRYLDNREVPDVIYCAVPPLKVAEQVGKYACQNSVRYIVDIQDLWPEAFQMVFNMPIISNIIFYPLKKLADKAYMNADAVCAVSESYVKRALNVNRKNAVGKAVFLGTELEYFDQNVKQYEQTIIKKEGELWLAYCGSLGDSYDIKCVIDALAILKKKNLIPPKFIVMGCGEKATEFKDYADERNVSVLFTGYLPYKEMCGLLCECDITVNPIVKGSAASIINKHADYAASGLPVLNTQESEEYRNLIDKYTMGFNCKNSDPEDLSEKMMELISSEKLRKTMGKNARKCAEEKFDRKNSYCEIVNLIVGK